MESIMEQWIYNNIFLNVLKVRPIYLVIIVRRLFKPHSVLMELEKGSTQFS